MAAIFSASSLRAGCGALAFITLIAAAKDGVVSAAGDALISQIGVFARAHDLQALSRIENKVAHSHSRQVMNMYFVGRHYANPTADRVFIRDFPTDVESIANMYALTPAVTGRHGTYAFDELALMADHGRRDAIEKLVEVVSNADGAVGEFASDRLSMVARARPTTTLQVLSRLPPPMLDRVVQNPLPWCDSASKLQAVAPQSIEMRKLQVKIHVSSLRC